MKIEIALAELISKGILSGDTKWQASKLQGGTVSELNLLENTEGDRIIVKGNNSALVDTEGEFLKLYADLDLVPNILYIEKNRKYLVYNFIEGETNPGEIDKKQMLKSLVEGLINHYKITKTYEGWGWADDLSHSWMHFLEARVNESTQLLANYLSEVDFKLVQNLVQNQSELYVEPYFLHGDCGVHNFIYKEGELTGVIDAAPVIGHPLYDLIYAFCSTAEDLSKETIDYGFSFMDIKNQNSADTLYHQVVIGLYCRLATCLKHHPQDWPNYKEAWDYWRAII